MLLGLSSKSIDALMLGFSLSLGRFDFLDLMETKVVGINTASAAAEATVVHLFKANDDWVLDAALVYRCNRTDLVVPVRLWTKNFNFRTALNHKFYP